MMVPMPDGYKAVMTSNFNSWGVVKERVDKQLLLCESKEEKFEKVLKVTCLTSIQVWGFRG